MIKNVLRPVLVALAITTFLLCLIGASQAQENLIVNGDFELGNQDFGTDYIENPTANRTDNILDEGQFIITNNPYWHHSGAADFGDHTTGSGLMMMVNAATAPAVVVWSQTVSVVAYADYEFELWAACWDQTCYNAANLQVKINSLVSQSIQLGGSGGIWQQLAFSFNSGDNTSVTIEIVELTRQAGGDDFVLDDISLELVLASNIKPGSYPNSINTCSGGATPVTIFGSETFDVNKIDVDKLLLATAQIKTVGKSERSLCSIEDVGSPDPSAFDNLGTPDGYDDLTCHFVTTELGLGDASTTADLTIKVCDDPNDVDGCMVEDPGYEEFTATDSVNIVKDCN
jgi:hypothetical protein